MLGQLGKWNLPVNKKFYEVIEQEFSVPVKWGFPWEVAGGGEGGEGGGGEIPDVLMYIANTELRSIVWRRD